ncbi:hypothetical protein [Vibrio sp.]
MYKLCREQHKLGALVTDKLISNMDNIAVLFFDNLTQGRVF